MLTPKQEAFAAHFSRTHNAAESYRAAYDVEPNAKDHWIYVEASQLLDHPEIALRVKELEAKARERSEYTIVKAMEELEDARKLGKENAQTGAVVAAINSKVKLAGLDKPVKVQEVGEDGKPKKEASVKEVARAMAAVLSKAMHEDGDS